MLPRLLHLHPSTSRRLVQLSKEAERDGAYRVARRLRAVVLNAEGRTSSELAKILQSPRSKVSQWLSRYETYGLEGLLEGYRPGRPASLSPEQREQLGDILDSGPVAYGLDTGIWTSSMITWVIEQEFAFPTIPAMCAACCMPWASRCNVRAECWRGLMLPNKTAGIATRIRI